MSDAVAKRAGSKKIYDTRIANRLIADILVVSDRFAAQHPQTLVKFTQGWLEGVEFIKTQPARAYTLIGTIKDFNIPCRPRQDHARRREARRLRGQQSVLRVARLGFRLRQHLQHGPGDVPRTAADQADSRPRRQRGPALHRAAERQVLHGFHRGADRVQRAGQGRDAASRRSGAPSTSRPIRRR